MATVILLTTLQCQLRSLWHCFMLWQLVAENMQQNWKAQAAAAFVALVGLCERFHSFQKSKEAMDKQRFLPELHLYMLFKCCLNIIYMCVCYYIYKIPFQFNKMVFLILAPLQATSKFLPFPNFVLWSSKGRILFFPQDVWIMFTPKFTSGFTVVQHVGNFVNSKIIM